MTAGVIGVLALQGGVEPHLKLLSGLGFSTQRVRDAESILGCAGLVLPGGESTAQQKLIARFGLGCVLDAFVDSGRPLLATCAGLVLAAQRGYLDVEVERNAYGSQVNSFRALTDPPAESAASPPPERDAGERHALAFIRAPAIRGCGPDVQVLARVQGEPVAVAQATLVATSGHPELTGDGFLHHLAFACG